MIYSTISLYSTHPRVPVSSGHSTHLSFRPPSTRHPLNLPIRHTTTTPPTNHHPLIPLKNPLLAHPSHKLHSPLLHLPLPARARQHFPTIAVAAAFTFQQHQFVYILAVSRARLAFPLVLAKVHAGEVSSGVRRVAGSGDGDVLGCEGVLGGDVVEAEGGVSAWVLGTGLGCF
jgi:hypothetical protein